jgi:hypothetical protein
MGNLTEWLKNIEPLKIVILDYEDNEVDLINFSDEYRLNHCDVFKRKKDKEISESEFGTRLYYYLSTPKVSELIVILYLEDLKGIAPTIYELNKLLNRREYQYSATYREVKKLEELDIILTKSLNSSNRREKKVYLNKGIVKVYGDDTFRKMMLDEWDTDAKGYIQRKLEKSLKDKEKAENRIRLNKKGRRIK